MKINKNEYVRVLRVRVLRVVGAHVLREAGELAVRVNLQHHTHTNEIAYKKN